MTRHGSRPFQRDGLYVSPVRGGAAAPSLVGQALGKQMEGAGHLSWVSV